MNNFVSPTTQAINLVLYIGDKVKESAGEPIDLPNDFSESIGAPSEKSANKLLKELRDKDIVEMSKLARVFDGRTTHDGPTFVNVNLTLNGWKQYEVEKHRQLNGKYGFIAMQFDDPVLTRFVENVVKPAVKESIGYDLVDMSDVARAGVIDDTMRQRIRDAIFVIADLTHDNSGAYWEAGYAEGAEKPVIYICEKEKFETDGTHFDTNHCTTVLWSKDDNESFCQNLTAIISRSLDQS